MMHEMDGMFGMKLMHRMDVMHGMFEIHVVFFVYMKVYVMDGSDAWGGCMGRMHGMDASHAKKKTSQLRVLILFCFVLFVFVCFPFSFLSWLRRVMSIARRISRLLDFMRWWKGCVECVGWDGLCGKSWMGCVDRAATHICLHVY